MEPIANHILMNINLNVFIQNLKGIVWTNEMGEYPYVKLFRKENMYGNFISSGRLIVFTIRVWSFLP